MSKNYQKTLFLVQTAAIAALYAALTYAAAAFNLAYGPVQFRFSEALTVLPVFTPAAVPGLALGCFLSNLASPLGAADWVFGTSATLLAAICTRAVRKITCKGVPVLAPLMPVLFNTFIIGFEIACLTDTGNFGFGNFTWAALFAGGVCVGIGELVVCYALGIPLTLAIRKSKLEDRLFQLKQL